MMDARQNGLSSALQTVVDGRPFPVDEWSSEWPSPEALGLMSYSAQVRVPLNWRPLQRSRVLSQLDVEARAWIQRFVVLPVVGSTNDMAMEEARQGSVEGLVLHAEMQIEGRGRRGRTWISPLGGSVSLTLGFDWPGPPASLSGLSPVVGLAVLDALRLVGAEDVGLKWPNDLLTPRGKLAGILIELLPAADSTRVVVGVGVNLRASDLQRDRVGQPIDDLESVCNKSLPERSLLVATLISHIARFVVAFRLGGFGPFADAYDANHLAHAQEVTLHEGDRERRVRVLGIAADGGLKIESSNAVEVLHGGEVSLRLRY